MVVSIHHTRYENLRTILKNLRKNAGLTQVELAKRLHMEQSNLSKIERGERYLDTLLFIDYCTACGANPSDVMARLENSTELKC